MSLSPREELSMICWNVLFLNQTLDIGKLQSLYVEILSPFWRKAHWTSPTSIPLYQEENSHTFIFSQVEINHNTITSSLYFLSTFNPVYIHYHILPELGNIQCPVHIDCSINVRNHWHCYGYCYYFKSNHQKGQLQQVFFSSSTTVKFWELSFSRCNVQGSFPFPSFQPTFWGVPLQTDNISIDFLSLSQRRYQW